MLLAMVRAQLVFPEKIWSHVGAQIARLYQTKGIHRLGLIDLPPNQLQGVTPCLQH